ncbi:hypothetical protein BJ878DRAFT_577167 [Calycina marina]|uniref:2EXR domain-containing protein n=1 Tax=Calycina marina TaxID=1763456 RepID=A0A9P8CEX1_9HELO|nr:hypothetical protein BJ878DRAFT_577167 [Calycina marina]
MNNFVPVGRAAWQDYDHELFSAENINGVPSKIPEAFGNVDVEMEDYSTHLPHPSIANALTSKTMRLSRGEIKEHNAFEMAADMYDPLLSRPDLFQVIGDAILQRERIAAAMKRRVPKVDEPVFPSFSGLPPEIRLMVWHLSFICQKVRIDFDHIKADWEHQSKAPVALHVNRESRAYALQHYTLIRITKRTLMFNPRIDHLVFPGFYLSVHGKSTDPLDTILNIIDSHAPEKINLIKSLKIDFSTDDLKRLTDNPIYNTWAEGIENNVDTLKTSDDLYDGWKTILRFTGLKDLALWHPELPFRPHDPGFEAEAVVIFQEGEIVYEDDLEKFVDDVMNAGKCELESGVVNTTSSRMSRRFSPLQHGRESTDSTKSQMRNGPINFMWTIGTHEEVAAVFEYLATAESAPIIEDPKVLRGIYISMCPIQRCVKEKQSLKLLALIRANVPSSEGVTMEPFPSKLLHDQ